MLIETVIVSSNGILFNGYRYSCSYAIKYKWFEIVARSGPWENFISYEPADPSVIWIYIEEGMILIKANILIIYSITPSKRKAYFKRINKLKTQRKTAIISRKSNPN
jgi:hypothetical protein